VVPEPQRGGEVGVVDLFGDDVLWQAMCRHAQRHSARFAFDEVARCCEGLLSEMATSEA
jgi:hypothetical protein